LDLLAEREADAFRAPDVLSARTAGTPTRWVAQLRLNV